MGAIRWSSDQIRPIHNRSRLIHIKISANLIRTNFRFSIAKLDVDRTALTWQRIEFRMPIGLPPIPLEQRHKPPFLFYTTHGTKAHFIQGVLSSKHKWCSTLEKRKRKNNTFWEPQLSAIIFLLKKKGKKEWHNKPINKEDCRIQGVWKHYRVELYMPPISRSVSQLSTMTPNATLLNHRERLIKIEGKRVRT